ncbi:MULTISPECIES: GAF domain-containing protein [Streptomyces]|uniref:GAF domain-containing protein n=2 Tax=Streptomyces TaxID=1883 RepID=A0ABU4KJB5_9ACTN|nr:GAF domain-containing protein [Streptomyces roseolus]MDX2297866.1 GAF domain-containing protein [Streptomyces roseolus]
MVIMDEDVEREQARLPMLLEAVLGVGTDLELRATLQHLVDSATELVGAHQGALRVVDPERPRLTGLFTTGMTDEERARAGRLPGGPSGELGVPIRVYDQVFGHLHLSGKPGGFTEEDLALLRVLAAQAGIAIGNARLYETARQRERWIEGAAAVTTALLTGESAEDALMTVAEQARILAGAAAGVILQPTPEGGMEIVTASTSEDPGDLVGTTIRPGSAVLVQLLGGEPVFVEDSSTDPRMTTPVRSRFGPSMMLPRRSGGPRVGPPARPRPRGAGPAAAGGRGGAAAWGGPPRRGGTLRGTRARPRRRGDEPYSAVDRLLASQFASQAALALVLADAQHDRERLAVFEDRDRIARDLHDLVVQRLFATEMMLESTRRRAGEGSEEDELLGRAVDELDSTIQEVRTTIFALQQPPAEAPTTFRGRVLRETGGAGVLLGFQPSVRFTGAVDTLVDEPEAGKLLAALRGALAAAHRRPGVGRIQVDVGVGEEGAWLRVEDDGTPPTTVTFP